MKKGQIITLEDNEKYLLLLDTIQEGHKFFYANKLTNDEQTTNEYEIFEETQENDETFMEIVDDDEVKEFLTKVFTVDMIDLVTDIEDGTVEVEDN